MANIRDTIRKLEQLREEARERRLGSQAQPSPDVAVNGHIVEPKTTHTPRASEITSPAQANYDRLVAFLSAQREAGVLKDDQYAAIIASGGLSDAKAAGEPLTPAKYIAAAVAMVQKAKELAPGIPSEIVHFIKATPIARARATT